MTYEELVERWDKLEAAEAVARAWQDPGPRHGSWHKRAREELASSMPLLARHLDRLLVELELPRVVEWELWESWPTTTVIGMRDRTYRSPGNPWNCAECGHLPVAHEVDGKGGGLGPCWGRPASERHWWNRGFRGCGCAGYVPRWDGLTDWQRFRLRVTGRYTAYVINRTAAQCTAILQHARLGEPVPVDRG